MPEEHKPEDSGSGTGTPPAGTTPTPPEAPKPLSLTQEELDRIIADRVRRAVPADYEELKKLKAEKDAAAEAEKTELEKEREARRAAERAAKEKDSKANAKLIRAALTEQAAVQNAIDAEVIVAILQGSADITVDDEGEVAGAKEAVAKLLKDKPVLAKGKSSASGGEFGGNDPKTAVAKIAELERRMNDPQLSQRERQDAGREARALKMASIA